MPKKPSGQPANQVAPDSRLEKRSRRAFSQDYKRRIIAEADACKHGELGQLLRRERLYSSQLKEWRRQLAGPGGQGLRGLWCQVLPFAPCLRTGERCQSKG